MLRTMHITKYEHTVTITIELSYDEERALETVRKASLGPYWERTRFTQTDTNNHLTLTLDDVVFLRNAIAACIGKRSGTSSLFTVNNGETREDVPGGGELADTANQLYHELNDILVTWGHVQADTIP